MAPKKSGGLTALLAGGDACPVGGECLFGTTAPPWASHALVGSIAAMFYFHHTGDSGAGWASPWIAFVSDLLHKVLPADWSYWVLRGLFWHNLLALFPTEYNKWWASQLGWKSRTLQLSAAVSLPSVGAFWLSSFNGFVWLVFASGYNMAMYSTIKDSNDWKAIATYGTSALLVLWAAANGAVSNFQHAQWFAAWLTGAIAFASLAPAREPAAAPAKRGRSKKR